MWAAFVVTLVLFFNQVNGDFTYWTWIKSGSFELPFNLLVDNLSLFMCLVITGVGGLIVTYSVGYMAHEDDPSYARFFTLHGRVHLLDAAARPGRELRVPDHRLGAGRPELVLPDRLLVPAALGRAGRAQGVRDERDRRRRHDPRRLRPVRAVTTR